MGNKGMWEGRNDDDVIRMGVGVVGIMKGWERWERKEVGLSWKDKLLKMQFNQHVCWEVEARSSNGGGGDCSRGGDHNV